MIRLRRHQMALVAVVVLLMPIMPTEAGWWGEDSDESADGVLSEEDLAQEERCGLTAESFKTLQQVAQGDLNPHGQFGKLAVVCASEGVGGAVGGAAGTFAAGWVAEQLLPANYKWAAQLVGGALGYALGQYAAGDLTKAGLGDTFEDAVTECCTFMKLPGPGTSEYRWLSEDDFKKQFRQLSRAMHPDKPSGSDDDFVKLVACDSVIRVDKQWAKKDDL